MATQIYTFPAPAACQDDFGLTAQFLLPILNNCSVGELLPDPCANWIALRCPADPPYYNPVVQGDVIYFQLQLPDPVNVWPDTGGNQPYALGWNEFGGSGTFLITASVRDYCTGSVRLLDIATETQTDWVGKVRQGAQVPKEFYGQTVQTIGIKVDNLPDIFQIEFEHATKGKFWSEVYRKETCSETVLFEGISTAVESSEDPTAGNFPTQGDTDCKGNLLGWDLFSPYRSVGNNLRSYRVLLRTTGYFREVGKSFEATRTADGIKIGVSSQTEQHQYRAANLPDYVVGKLATIFSLDVLAINGDAESVWQGPESLTKNNEIGTTWIVEANIQRVVCRRQKGCTF
jgi:hypothetical protein